MGEPTAVLIETRGLSRSHPQQHIHLLQPTHFQLRGGDRVAITGSSGSGKSVFLRALAWLDEPGGGELLWHGHALTAGQIPGYRRHVCYLAQRPALLNGTVEDNLRFPFSLHTAKHLRFDASAVSTLLAHAGKNPAFLAKEAGDLSGGEAQIVALIRALQLGPDVLLLDEPTAALDAESALAVEALIDTWFAASTARAFVWVSHDKEQALRMSTRLLHMNAGVLSAEVPR